MSNSILMSNSMIAEHFLRVFFGNANMPKLWYAWFPDPSWLDYFEAQN